MKNINPNYVASKEELMYEKLGQYEDLGSVEELSLKATCWDIMFKKNVDLKELKKWIYAESKNIVESAMEKYNQQVAPSEQLTKEEFKVLKEGLEYEQL